MTAQAAAPFIVGVPRSGTTLLRLMLDAHPNLAVPFETHFIANFIGGRDTRSLSAHAFCNEIVATPYWKNLGLSATALHAAVESQGPFSVADGLRTLYGLYAAQFGKTRWGDKTPPYLRSMVGLQELLPEAHFIHIVRDGRDTALSLRNLWFGPGRDVGAAAEFWMTEIANARKQAHQLNHYIELKYEALVHDPETMLKIVCQYLKIDYAPAMLDFHRTAAARLSEVVQSFGPHGTSGPDIAAFLAIHDSTSRPPDAGRIGRWKADMSDSEQSQFEKIAGRWLAEFNSETRFSSRSAPAGIVEGP